MINLKDSPFFLSDTQAAWVGRMFSSLSPEEKAGQLFCVMGDDYTPEVLEETVAGGVCDGTLFGWPMLTAAAGTTETAERFGKVCGTEDASAGINWTFSPVYDPYLSLWRIPIICRTSQGYVPISMPIPRPGRRFA